ncbi:TetR/AcrR family transcriptional regulator [Actinophytocola algeriensis]|jgi:AcrR family transcriptional regulator|uniref:AcrR family transcriptional regulator n=1 Tax=Actinophytocola algeriensis TaxID=1768010 RepID=A0A7W7Q4A7_9PSEU|nr:TetR family transcriptional regulator [Actinophytocola algeriensis]MBB4906827.1 AcrR family transcriptional regulator [Actinophytocola algeriensis]MBE1478308.1 AcrR family transcriptional regulator [Actinophytocola algeriensis]
MARTADPARRVELIDAIIVELSETGLATFSLRTLAAALGRSTRVLTHHFADKDALLAAVLARLDEQQHEALRATEGWADPAIGIGTIVRDAWRRHLSPAELPRTRLIHEIEGLAAAGRLATHVPAFVSGRATFVAAALELRGLPAADALTKATLLNNAYAGLQADFLTTGEAARTEAALAELCELANSWTVPRTVA